MSAKLPAVIDASVHIKGIVLVTLYIRLGYIFRSRSQLLQCIKVGRIDIPTTILYAIVIGSKWFGIRWVWIVFPVNQNRGGKSLCHKIKVLINTDRGVDGIMIGSSEIIYHICIRVVIHRISTKHCPSETYMLVTFFCRKRCRKCHRIGVVGKIEQVGSRKRRSFGISYLVVHA